MADLPRFGASDFWLVQTDAAQLREKLRVSLATLLGRDVVDSDPHMVLASAFLPYLVQGEASADACAKATLRAFASGQDLDRIADSTCVVGYLDRISSRGAILPVLLSATITRSDATHASVCHVSWTATRTTESAAGDELTFSGSGSFDLAFALTDGATKVLSMPAYLICETPGTVGNSIFEDVPAPLPDAAISVSITLTESAGVAQTYSATDVEAYRCGATYGGAADESDEDFAIRVAWQAKAVRVPGSLEYFRLALSEIRYLPSWYVAPTADSEGRIVMAWCDKVNWLAHAVGHPLTTRGAGYDEFLSVIKDSLLVEQRAYVYPATQEALSFQVMYCLPASTTAETTARQAVEAAWAAYVESHAWHCGAALRLCDMHAALSSGGASQVVIRSRGDITLAVDQFVTASAFTLIYLGLSTDEVAPVGADGEEVTP